MSFKLGSVNVKYNERTATFKRDFDLAHKGDPLFKKEFEGNNTSKVLLGKNQFVIPNHFYVTGEELYYKAEFEDSSAIGIDHTSPGVGAATTLPQTVYAIKVDENNFKVASSKANALNGDPIGLTTVGVGQTHYFEAQKENTKCIIAIDNIIQAPVKVDVEPFATLVSNAGNTLDVSDVSDLKANDIINIEEEMMLVRVVNPKGRQNRLLVERRWLGTDNGPPFINGADVKKVTGDYNIVGNKIHFVSSPFSGLDYSVGISSELVDVSDNSFIVLDDVFQTGDEVRLISERPPAPLVGDNNYFIIKNGNNNFSLANTEVDANSNAPIDLTSVGVGTFRLRLFDKSNNSSFQGRQFIRSDYSGNIQIDNIAPSFTGIAKTFTLTSEGSNITGITTDFGSILINNIFQKPDTDYDFIGGESTGITSIRFTGQNVSGNEALSTKDVTANAIPRKGMLVSISNTEGFGYQPQYTAIGTVTVGSSGTITDVFVKYEGSGYRSGGADSLVWTAEDMDSTSPATGSFTISDGLVTGATIEDGGAGFYAPRVVNNLIYDHISGLATVTTVAAHNLKVQEQVRISGVGMTCLYDGGVTPIIVPRSGDPAAERTKVLDVINANQFTVKVGTSTTPHFFDSNGHLGKPTRVEFKAPIPYDDMQLVSKGGVGIGASVSVIVGSGTSITNIELGGVGYGYTFGEELNVVGIPTITGIGTTFANAVFTITGVRDDEWAGWVFGKLQPLDDFSDEFDGRKTTFALRNNGKRLSIEKVEGSLIELDQVLLIFINDVLQKPGESYTFDGGTRIRFKEPPVSGSSLQILFYRGTDSDIQTGTSLESIKIGDTVTIRTSDELFTPVQDPRIVTEIASRDSIETNVYSGAGIRSESNPLRPVTWSKQKQDKFISGVLYTKDRDVYASRIFGNARLIQSVGFTSIKAYAESGSVMFRRTEDPDNSEFGVRIIDTEKDNSGFGTIGFNGHYPLETIKEGVTVVGDDGIITGVGTTANSMQLNFHIPVNSVLRENRLGGIIRTGISTGDYFVISRSNVGSGVTALAQDRDEVIGIATQFLDGVYQVAHLEDVDPVGTAGSMKVTVNIESGHGLDFTGLSSGTGNNYGTFSWARFDFIGGRTGLAFTCNTLNGLTGLSTAPQIIRYTKLSTDYS